uniref:SGNH domain-containing protein n=1 Tax=Angiostrongylus cantonensis TaxID=6313 RepID=A0A0K0D3V1_ANGCA
MGKLSYSLYLIHWPIYIIVKTQLPNSIMSLHIGVVTAVIASVLLTETFEKFYLRADMKTIFCLILSLYAIIGAFYMNEMPKKLLINGSQRINEMFTPVCTLKNFDSHEICDIPFNRMNLSTEEIIRIDDFNCANDMTQLFYGRCSYRSDFAPWGWCDLSSENRTSVHKILVIGNSYAANQGRIVHEMCANSNVEVKIFQQNACEVLRVTMEYYHCRDSRRIFYEAVRQYNPDVLFILTRHLGWMELPTTTSNEAVAMIVSTAAAILRDLSQVVTDRIFVLHAIPRQKFNIHLNPSDVLGVGKVLDQMSFISQSLNLALARTITEKAVASCRKCRVIDYTQVFTVNNTYKTFDERTLLAYVNCQLHFTPYGLHRLRPFFKRICDNISYSRII